MVQRVCIDLVFYSHETREEYYEKAHSKIVDSVSSRVGPERIDTRQLSISPMDHRRFEKDLIRHTIVR